MRFKNCLGVACFILVLFVSCFLNGGINQNSDLKMTSNESGISTALNGNQISTNFNNNQISTQNLMTSQFAREVNHDLADYLIPENSYFAINGQELDENITVNYGDAIDVHLEWSLPNTERWTTDDVFTYQLPKGFEFTNVQNGPVRNESGQTVGVYTITNNEVMIQYTDENFVKLSNIVGALNVSGKITESSYNSGDGGIIDLNIPGVGHILVNVNPTSALRINKSVTKIDTDTYEFNVVVRSITDNTNVVITDTMGKYLELINNSLKITNNGSIMTDGVKLTINSSLNFVYEIEKLNKGDEVVITYQVNVLDGGFISNSTDNDLRNTASVKSDELPNGISASALVTTKKASLSKSGSYNISDNTVTWTIIVKPGEKGVTLEDIISDDQEITGNIKVEESDNGSTYYDSELVITVSYLEKGYTFTADSTGNKAYRITFKTKATTTGATQLYNKATIYVGDSDHVDKDATVGLVPGVNIDKTVSSADDREGIINWNTKVTIPNIDNNLKYTIFKDVLGTGLTLVKDSVKVNGQTIDETTNYKLEITDNGFNIDFGKINPGQIFDISYQTEFDNSESQKFTNTATVSVNGEEKSDTAEYNYNKKSNYIQKKVTTSEDSFSKTGIARWEITIDRLPKNVTDAFVTDVIPEGMEFIENSAKIVINNNTYDLAVIPNNNKLIFNLDNYMASLDQGSATIYYETRLIDIFSEQKKYTNKANITIDDETYPDVEASITGQVTNLLSKTAVYNTSTAPLVEYTIKVNEGAADISPTSNKLRLEDQMGSAIEFVRGSLNIDGEAADSDSYTWDSENRVLIINVPDETSLTITYQALVTLIPGDELNDENAFNRVNLDGYDENQAESEWIIKGEVLESNASSSSDSATLRVYKHKEGDANTPLANVKFNLYEVEFTVEDGVFNFTGEETLVNSLTTASDGFANFTGLNYDRVYKLVETETLNDYIINSVPYYFVFPGNDNITYPDYVDGGYEITKYDQLQIGTVEIGNEYSFLDINISKVWEDHDYSKRPDSITVYLKRNGEYVIENGQKKSVTLSSSNNWQASFEGLVKYDDNHNRYKYTIEEAVPEHYRDEYNESFTIDEENWIITNTLDDSSLTISKFVAGNAGDKDKEFTFKVILTDKNGNPLENEFFYNGSKKGIIKSGDTVKLKHGESIIINGLPVETNYEVIELEANSDRYETTATNDKGTIDFDENKVVFTNTKNEGSLTIDKTVGGNSGETDRYFNFKVILFDKDGNVLEGIYNYTGSKTGTIKSGDIIRLKHGESITITGLPVGASYEVIELEANSDGYTTKITNGNGIIGLDGNISSFMNYKDIFKKYEKSNIPQTGGSDNTSIYGILTLVFGILGICLVKKVRA